MRVCIFCGSEFAWERQPGQRGRTKIYCSRSCGKKAKYVSHPREDLRTPEQRSIEMASVAQARWIKIAPADRSSLMRQTALRRYTPEQIERRAARLADREIRAKLPCPYCGDPVGRAGRVKCPKPECNLSHNAARMQAINQQRRAIQRDPDAERFDPVEIYERDQWICGICEEPVDPVIRWPDPNSVSLDHIEPLSLGGRHTRANTRCSHLICNTRRGNRVA